MRTNRREGEGERGKENWSDTCEPLPVYVGGIVVASGFEKHEGALEASGSWSSRSKGTKRNSKNLAQKDKNNSVVTHK